jgi:hypothetical protein
MTTRYATPTTVDSRLASRNLTLLPNVKTGIAGEYLFVKCLVMRYNNQLPITGP